MHRGLCIPEVVELICSVAEFPTLATLAQTCQIFQPPALSVIWRDHSNLLRLLKCLPSDLWELEEVEEGPPGLLASGTNKLRFRRPIVPSDWTRVFFYAVYVKTLVQDSRSPVTAEIYAALSLSLPKHPLFPNIRNLIWRTEDDIFPYIRILVGDKLKSIVLDMHGSEIIRSSLLPSLTTFHPKLTHVEFDPTMLPGHPSMVMGAIYSAICSWNYLEKLGVTTLDLPSMLHLARLPNLKCLSLFRFPDWAMTKEFQAGVASTGPVFAALRELSTYSPIAPITVFLDVIDPDALDNVDLTILTSTLTEHWQTLNTSLARKSSKTLTKLSLKQIYNAPDHDDYTPERMLTPDSLRPLLSFANLAQVTINAPYGIDIDDALLKQMALAWPQLEKLDLAPVVQHVRYAPQITLPGLIPLAQHCPLLASLALVLNATDTDPYSKEKPGGGVCNRSLVDLDVVESPLTSPGAVASFLSAIFPNLQRVANREELMRNPDAADWEDNMFNWETVSSLVQVISSARAQEHSVPTVA
ncbi:hypothetical protein C8R44DRAFT_692839 [Mycena epipterygia]|nr:hypothetical protein C8R44DRAFT_692839 [Mycena epipterygia]